MENNFPALSGDYFSEIICSPMSGKMALGLKPQMNDRISNWMRGLDIKLQPDPTMANTHLHHLHTDMVQPDHQCKHINLKHTSFMLIVFK